MINIIDKSKCCGCNACTQICSKKCITMYEDTEGFLYPKVDLSLCIDCHLCEKVCPVIKFVEDNRFPKNCYAARNIDTEITKNSSSGGIFSAIAEKVISDGGVVFGAKFDEEWNVVHDYTDSFEGLKVFRGSKYAQSRIGNTYCQAKHFLEEGRQVMYSGTPCQIAGLKNYLHKDYEKLLAVDIICHGVPSPAVWNAYLKVITGNKFNQISDINFRDKTFGWSNRKYRMSVEANNRQILYSKAASKDKYMNCFLRNLTIRPSCYMCPAKCGRSGSDILLGDLWGVEVLAPNLNDEKGTSTVIAYTAEGEKMINQLKITKSVIDYTKIVLNNPAIENNADISLEREKFWDMFCKEKERAIKAFGKPLEPPFIIKLRMVIYNILRKYKGNNNL